MIVLKFQMNGTSKGLRQHRWNLVLFFLTGALCGAFTGTIAGAQDVKPTQDPNLASLPTELYPARTFSTMHLGKLGTGICVQQNVGLTPNQVLASGSSHALPGGKPLSMETAFMAQIANSVAIPLALSRPLHVRNSAGISPDLAQEMAW